MVAHFESLEWALLALLGGNCSSDDGSTCPLEPGAVPLSVLRRHGVDVDDLRWLVDKGYVDPISHKGSAGGPRPATSTASGTSSRTAFVLTTSGLAVARQIVGSCDVHGPDSPARTGVPLWRAASRELFYAGLLVKKFRQPAPTQEMILSAFEEEGWPAHVLDPLPPLAGSLASERLRTTIRRLNNHQIHSLVRFESDGRGEGVCWRPRRDVD